VNQSPASSRELRDLYVAKAISAERAAESRKSEIRRSATIEAQKRITPRERRAMGEAEFNRYVEGVTTSMCSGSRNTPPDPTWRKHVDLNQWYIQQAIMFGTQATGEALDAILAMLQTIATSGRLSTAVAHGQEDHR
jgi:hypothetical protein